MWRIDRPYLRPPVKPLALRNRRDEPYVRLPPVEEKLRDILGMATRREQWAALERKRGAGGAVAEETLAYFVRECQRAENRLAVSDFAKLTLERCSGFIWHSLYGLDEIDRQEACNDVIAKVFRDILALEKSRGEYYQVRFWHAMRRECIDHYRKCRTKTERRGREVADSEAIDGVGIEDPRIREMPDREALLKYRECLPEKLRGKQWAAFILHELKGYPPKDLAKYHGVTERNIGYWIKDVRDALQGCIERNGNADVDAD